MPVPNQHPFRFFVSYVLMTHGGNPFGHVSMMISQLDTRNPNARVEVLEGLGFYSRYSAYTGYQFVAEHGRVKNEAVIDLVNTKGLSHMTFEISEAEMLTLMQEINADRRQVEHDEPSHLTVKDEDENAQPIDRTIEYYKPSGPGFNLFKGDNCKRYVLNKLQKLGVDIGWMSGFLEIPKMSSGLQPLFIEQGTRSDKPVYCWKTPLVLSPRRKDQPLSSLESTSQQFLALQQGIMKILEILREREKTLKSQGRVVSEITNTIPHIQQIQNDLIAIQGTPGMVNNDLINRSYGRLSAQIDNCVQSLNAKHIEADLIHQLIDSLAETYRRITHYLFGFSFANSPDSKDRLVFEEVNHIQRSMRAG